MKAILSFVILSILLAPLYAQNKDSLPTYPERSYYIEKHQEQIALKLAFTNNTQFFEVNNPAFSYTLKPNTALKTNLIFSYRFLLIGVGFSPKLLPFNNDEERKGKSKIFWLGTNINLPHFTQRFSYNTNKGFYLSNTSDFVPEWNENEDAYIQFPELEYKGFSGYSAYKLNSNFSFLAIETQTERQLRSAGSFVPVLTYRYYKVDNKIELTEQMSSQKSSNFETNLQLGYFYTHVINHKFYLSGGVAAGGGVIFTKLTTRYIDTNYQTKDTNPIFRAEAMAAMGYNSKRFFTGFHLLGNFEHFSQSNSSTTLVNESIALQFFAGYRFNAPKFVRNKHR